MNSSNRPLKAGIVASGAAYVLLVGAGAALAEGPWWARPALFGLGAASFGLFLLLSARYWAK